MSADGRRADGGAHIDRVFRRSLTSALALVVLASGCTASNSVSDATESQTPAIETSAVAEPSTVRDAISDGATIIDVRTPEEFATGHLRGAVNIDVSEPDFDERIASLDETARYVVYCASGRRAGAAIKTMQEQGFDALINGGGYEDLASLGLPITKP